jgi:hypothetical protein
MPLCPSGFIEPCLPTISCTVPTGAGWAYEIKHDGFHFICRTALTSLLFQRFSATAPVAASAETGRFQVSIRASWNAPFQRLLAEQPMQFANLVLQSSILRSRNNLFTTAGR